MTKSVYESVKPVIIVGGVIVVAVGSYFIFRALAEGIRNFSYGASESVESLGQGVENALSSAGYSLENASLGVQSIGQGAGIGIANIGTGAGNLFTQTGAGIYELGGGAGYLLSGASPQDLLQTLLTWGGESSTYKAGGNPIVQNQANQNYLGQTLGIGGNTTTIGSSTFSGSSTPVFEVPELTPQKIKEILSRDEKSIFSISGNVVSGGSSNKSSSSKTTNSLGNNSIAESNKPKEMTFQGMKINIPESTSPAKKEQNIGEKVISGIGSFIQKVGGIFI